MLEDNQIGEATTTWFPYPSNRTNPPAESSTHLTALSKAFKNRSSSSLIHAFFVEDIPPKLIAPLGWAE